MIDRGMIEGRPVREDDGMIEVVMVSVNYADYLRHTLPAVVMWPQVSRVAVVTSPADEETRKVAEWCGAVPVVTDAFFRFQGAPCPFNKGAGINKGMESLSLTGWVLHLDADIMLADPLPDVRELDKHSLYHIRRRRVVGIAELARLITRGERHGFEPCRVLTRTPPGFFHLWHYPTCPRWQPESPAANQYDMWFAQEWPKERQIVLPADQHSVYHLETPDARKAANWRGRKTLKFA